VHAYPEGQENFVDKNALFFSGKLSQKRGCLGSHLRGVGAAFLLSLLFLDLVGCGNRNVPVPPQTVSLQPAPPPPRAVVAIIIDDVGYNERALPEAIALTLPVDFAVLPHLPYTRQLAEKLARGGFEIMLHQPMEPVSKSMDPGPGSIGTEMTREQIEAVLAENLEQLPLARGVNNHMGSKATSSRKVAEVVLPFVAERGLFFVDSLTTPRSVCRQVAEDLAIPIATRDVFLDNNLTREGIINQLEKLKNLAIRRGEAIGIGHFHSLTLRTLEEIAPSFEENGVEFVFVSEIIRRRQLQRSARNAEIEQDVQQ
jgi:polysaccharide deacetylase 2 family uncharacterized protein YibQ